MRINYKGIYIEDINHKEAATLLRSLSRVKYDEKEFELDPDVAEAVEGETKKKNKPGAGGSIRLWTNEEITFLFKTMDKPLSEIMQSPIIVGRKRPAVYGIRSGIKTMNAKRMSKEAFELVQKLAAKAQK